MNRKDLERSYLAMYDAHADTIFRFCFFKLRDREAAVEMTQDVFTRTWEYLARGQEIAHFRGFAFRVARNAIADYAKKSRPLYEHDLGEGAEKVFDIPIDGDAEVKAELSGLMECMNGLDESDRELVTLRYTEDVPVKDIAEELGEKPNTITVRLKRAVEALRECVGVMPVRRIS